MKVMVFDVPDGAVLGFLKSLQEGLEVVDAGGCAPPVMAVGPDPMATGPTLVKPPTQGVVAGLGEQSVVMKPTAPPMGVLKMMKLANHPWFQEWVAFIAPKPMLEAAGGDSLKLAQRLLGEVVLKGKEFKQWSEEQDAALADVENNYRIWAMKKGYNLDE